MADYGYYPDKWKQFCGLARGGAAKASPELSRFAARYRAAGNFSRAEFFGMSRQACEGNSAVIKVMLCYSTFEALCRALALRLADQMIVTSPLGPYGKCPRQLRAEYAGASSTAFPLRAALTDPKLRARLDAFMAGTSDDLLPVAAGLRHLFVHGVWTPSGGEVVSKRATKALFDLAQLILLQCDTMFSTHVRSLMGEEPRSSVDITYQVRGLNVLINTDKDEWFTAVCNVLGCPEARQDPRFGVSARRAPDPNNRRKALRAGGRHFPALHRVIHARLESLSTADIKRAFKKMAKLGVPVDLFG